MNASGVPHMEALGESALLLRWGNAVDPALNARVHAAAARLRTDAPAWLRDVVPAYASLALHFDDAGVSAGSVKAWAASRLADGMAAGDAVAAAAGRVVEIPVCYGGGHGPDLADVAAHHGQSADAVVARHAAGDYHVAMLGFSPGFPYLLGLDPALATPRLTTPRTRIPAGSVGIGGGQTGVYPDAGPGGWRLIGRTPLALFDPARASPSLLQPGDRVRFVSVDPARFDALRASRRAPPGAAAAADATVEVLAPGLQTTVQDLGRFGHRHLGVGVAGAIDTYSARLANRLVGNDDGAPLLEIALTGPRLRFRRAVRIAITGADIDAHVGEHALPGWRPVDLAAGTELVLGACRRGTRGYLAIAGGVAVPRVLGSAATDVRGGFGGVDGRALQAGDALTLGAASMRGGAGAASVRGGAGADAVRAMPRALPTPGTPAIARWWVDPSPDLDFEPDRPIRVLAGRDATPSLDALRAGPWHVGAQADRQGMRLDGPAIAVAAGGERVSEPVTPGTVQLPPDGRPIVLLGEAQTIGGYPRIAHVLGADLPRLVQRRAGEPVRFEVVDAGTAMDVACGQRARLARMALALEQHARDA